MGKDVSGSIKHYIMCTQKLTVIDNVERNRHNLVVAVVVVMT